MPVARPRVESGRLRLSKLSDYFSDKYSENLKQINKTRPGNPYSSFTEWVIDTFPQDSEGRRVIDLESVQNRSEIPESVLNVFKKLVTEYPSLRKGMTITVTD